MKASIHWKTASAAILCLGLGAAAAGRVAAPAANGQAPQAQPRPARVRVKLEGFNLAPQSSANKHSAANQIGGASRGLGVKLFAPEEGLAYSLHPTLQWSGSPDTKYKLEIVDTASHATFDATVDGTSFTYPETAAPLKPGNTYSWKVQPELDLMGGASETARMVIAGAAAREQIAAALSAITQTGEAGDRARAQVYFDKRVWYDAVEAYSILIAAHPQDRELRRARGSLYDQVPATEKLADADFAAAGPG